MFTFCELLLYLTRLMKIRLFKKKTIEDFVIQHASSKRAFLTWLALIKRADWTITNDISKTFNSADLLGKGCNRVVFNIGGNNYRMICKFQFGKEIVCLYIMWIGTHSKYTELCDLKLQFTVNNYKSE